MELQPGQITRLFDVALSDGSWSLCAEVVTAAGPVRGFLFVQENARESTIKFKPEEALTEAFQTEELAGQAPEGNGAMTTAQVPTRGGIGQVAGGGVSPDDPRGLKRGRR